MFQANQTTAEQSQGQIVPKVQTKITFVLDDLHSKISPHFFGFLLNKSTTQKVTKKITFLCSGNFYVPYGIFYMSTGYNLAHEERNYVKGILLKWSCENENAALWQRLQ